MTLYSSRNLLLRWLTLYAYGIVILASMTLTPALDAIRAMTVLTISARVARVIGYRAAPPSKSGSKSMMIGVPPDCMARFHAGESCG
ncbi:hypothetical protein BDR22DRAFT_859184 [Usnea florida]